MSLESESEMPAVVSQGTFVGYGTLDFRYSFNIKSIRVIITSYLLRYDVVAPCERNMVVTRVRLANRLDEIKSQSKLDVRSAGISLSAIPTYESWCSILHHSLNITSKASIKISSN